MDDYSQQSPYNAQTQSVMSDNSNYLTDSIIKLRLDPSNVIDKFELFLRGAELKIIKDEDGYPVRSKVVLGIARANDNGIAAIKNHVEMIVNTATVTGNRNKEEHVAYVCDCMEALADDLFDNLYKWGVDECDYSTILNRVWALIDPFTSRTINDGERRSLANQIVHKESNTLQEKKGGWNIFKRS